MNDFISIFLKDIYSIVNELIKKSIIQNSFDKSIISVDFFSKSRQGDISTNLLLVLKKFLINKNFNLNYDLQKKILKLKYVKKIKIANAGFINISFQENLLIENLSNVIKKGNSYGQKKLGKKATINIEFVYLAFQI